MKRIRFTIDNRERYWVISILGVESITLRDYIELLLTHLCAPEYVHPIAERLLIPTTREFLSLIRMPAIDPNPDPGEVSISWPDELIWELIPAFEASELDPPTFLSTLWAWGQAGDSFSPALKARLDKFANHWFLQLDDPGMSWTREGALADLPWNQYKELDND
jgi:hypothetical protein